MQRTAGYWIKELQLVSHVEGGYYNRTYSAGITLPQTTLPASFHGDRPASTAIYYLLEKDQFSALHRIASDELWHFYYGDPLIVYEIDNNGSLIQHLLGNNPEKGECFQCSIKAGNWFGAKMKDGGNYTLAGCTVSPGFDFADFELAKKDILLQRYPQHANIINMLTTER